MWPEPFTSEHSDLIPETSFSQHYSTNFTHSWLQLPTLSSVTIRKPQRSRTYNLNLASKFNVLPRASTLGQSNHLDSGSGRVYRMPLCLLDKSMNHVHPFETKLFSRHPISNTDDEYYPTLQAPYISMTPCPLVSWIGHHHGSKSIFYSISNIGIGSMRIQNHIMGCKLSISTRTKPESPN